MSDTVQGAPTGRKPYSKPTVRRGISWTVDDDTGCWIPSNKPDQNGYIRTEIKNRIYLVHRLSYMLFNGDIPDGYLVCHHCDNPSCMNPEHLFCGTQRDNMRDMHNKGRANTKGKHLSLKAKQIIEIRDSVESAYKVAERYGITWRQVYKIRNRECFKQLPKDREQLTDDDVRYIRGSTESSIKLGKHYGYHPSYIRRIRKRQARRDVD